MTRSFGLLVLACAGLSACTTPAARDADAQFQSGSDKPPTAQTLYTSARIMQSQGRDEEAHWVLVRIIRDYPKYAPAYSDLAEYYMRKNNFTEAVATLNDGLKACPDDPVLVNNLGMVAMMRGDYKLAQEHFTKAAALGPGNVRFRSNVGAALGMQGRYDESLSVYRQVLNESDAHYNVGVLAEARKDKERAAMEFDAAAKLSGGSDKPRENDKDTK